MQKKIKIQQNRTTYKKPNPKHTITHKYINIIGGDFNAEAGCYQESDDKDVIGDHPLHRRTERGEWLLQWCTLFRVEMTNTYGCKDIPSAWTFKNGGAMKVLDYVL